MRFRALLPPLRAVPVWLGVRGLPQPQGPRERVVLGVSQGARDRVTLGVSCVASPHAKPWDGPEAWCRRWASSRRRCTLCSCSQGTVEKWYVCAAPQGPRWPLYRSDADAPAGRSGGTPPPPSAVTVRPVATAYETTPSAPALASSPPPKTSTVTTTGYRPSAGGSAPVPCRSCRTAEGFRTRSVAVWPARGRGTLGVHRTLRQTLVAKDSW
mmetsp:Transcript_57346/g.102499  ORF Transcript_57346/g.102499 Transcript_57346/m.102499 type:complete len:212 (+) Transcript_57346:1167-1802(+)